MNELLIRYGIMYILIALLLTARPWLSRKNVMFGVVFGNTEIRKNEASHRIISRFVIACLITGIALAGAFLLAYTYLSPDEMGLTRLFSAAFFALLLVDMVPYILANRGMKKLKEALPDDSLYKGKITVEVGNGDINKPVSAAWFLLLLLPIAAAVVLAVKYYPELPEKLAIHFNQSGIADVWETKSINIIMKPIFNQILVAVILFIVGFFSRLAPASVKGNPEAAPGYAAFRRILSLFLIAIAVVIETEFLMTELTYLGLISDTHTTAVVIKLLIILFIIILFTVFFLSTRKMKSSGTILDDDKKWVLGMFYFNPSDSSLFVEKRNGIGRTINFGRPAAWIFIVALILFVVVRSYLRK